MEWYYIVLIVLLSIIVLYVILDLVVSYFLVRILIDPYCKPLDEAIEADVGFGKLVNKNEYYDYYKKETYDLKSPYGYNLKVYYIPKKKEVNFADGKERVVVLVHGYTSSHVGMLAYGKLYLDLGFHVICYDHRNHGQSDKAKTTMGNKEADDLQEVIKFAKSLIGNNIIIGTHGESMGSGTSMIHAGRHHSVDFVVEDCGFNNMHELLKYQCEVLKKIPAFPTMFFANIFYKLLTKSSFNDSNPEKMIADCDDIPMFFIHGDKDTFVPAYMVYKCYDAKNGFKMVKTFDCSIHARVIVEHKEEYAICLKEFLEKANVISKNSSGNNF